jgi:8-oxo-dGTP pyrophosphatase MutT (NUDIX family)
MMSARPPVDWPPLARAADDPPTPVLTEKQKLSAGAVIVEPDGRIWLCEPSNHFGGYVRTFPKGRVDPGQSMRAAAVREVFEETGLLVHLGAFLVDATRTSGVTRYFLAERVAGTPADMGWESQALWLVPLPQLTALAPAPQDAPVIAALRKGR